jgi:hypothetical protein
LQYLSGRQLKQLLIDNGFWDKIQRGELISKPPKITPAKITAGGTSQIISFYDGNSHHLCTLHRVLTKEGYLIHEDVKNVRLNGILYISND